MTDRFDAQLGAAAIRSRVIVDLGGIAVELASDQPDEAAFDRYPARLPDDHPPDVRVHCLDDPHDALALRSRYEEQTARSRSFAAGYYATDHFGPPLALWSSGDHYVVAGHGAAGTIWPYLVKVILARWAMATDAAFLKAGAVEIDGEAVLLLGRGGGGKTTLLDALCRSGAGFVANSHALVSANGVRGVVTALRVRVPATASATTDAPPVEVLVDPTVSYRMVSDSIPLRAVCFVEHGARSVDGMVRLGPLDAIGAVDHFGLGVHVYGLHEDLLDDLGGSFVAYSAAVEQQRSRIIEATSSVPIFQVSTDVLDPANLERVVAAVRSAS